MENHYTSFEILTAVKDILLIIFAMVTAKLAFDGLETWSKELKGKADFSVARNLIRSTYKLRDELSYCRSPWIPLSEFPEGHDPSNRSFENQAEAYNFIYLNRWKPVANALQDFEVQALEAESLWGADSKNKTDEMRQCVQNLQVSIEAFIRNYYENGDPFREDSDYKIIVKSDVQETRKSENPLTLKINSAISQIENHIRPLMKTY